MKNNSYEYPPYLYLSQVAERCPKAVATYMMLWREKDQNLKIAAAKQDIRTEFLISLAKFKHDLLLLVKEGLLSLNETPNWIHIELVGWSDEEEEDELC